MTHDRTFRARVGWAQFQIFDSNNYYVTNSSLITLIGVHIFIHFYSVHQSQNTKNIKVSFESGQCFINYNNSL